MGLRRAGPPPCSRDTVVDDRAAGREDGRVIHRAHHLDMVGLWDVAGHSRRSKPTPARLAACRPRRSFRPCRRQIRPACCQSRSKSAVFPRQATTRPPDRHPSPTSAPAHRQRAVDLPISPFRLPARESKPRRRPDFQRSTFGDPPPRGPVAFGRPSSRRCASSTFFVIAKTATRSPSSERPKGDGTNGRGWPWARAREEMERGQRNVVILRRVGSGLLKIVAGQYQVG